MTNAYGAPSGNGHERKPEPEAQPHKSEQKPAQKPRSQRSRARRNVIGRSPHREEYVRLMEAGWASESIERYAAFRFHEDVPASTIRSYRKKYGIATPQQLAKEQTLDRPIDVLAARVDLIELQRERIAIDASHERSMTKLFGSTKGEIELLSKLLDAHKADLQDLGMLPKAGESLTVFTSSKPSDADAPPVPTLAALFDADPDAEVELAKVLHLRQKGA